MPPSDSNTTGAPEFLPDGHALPPDYEVRHHSVYHVRERTDAQGQQAAPLIYRVTYGPLHIAAMAASNEGDLWYDLAWRDGHRPVVRRVDGSVLRSGRTLVRELGRAGFPAIEADAKQIERYLAAYLYTNHAALESARATIARHLGWQDDHQTFVTGDSCPWPVEPGQPEQRPALAAFRPKGNLDGWKLAIRRLQAYPVVVIALAASFGAPLLPILNVHSFTIDISGRSSRGKSTTVQITMSVWADPSPLGHAIGTWKSGLIMIEKRLNLVRGLPTVLDGASGFLYYVSVAGITGKQQAATDSIEQAVARLKRATDLPVAVGFGVRTPEQARVIARVADGVVVGSALVEIVGQHGTGAPEHLREYAASLAEAVHSARKEALA